MHINQPLLQQRLQPLFKKAGAGGRLFLDALQGPVQLTNATPANYYPLAAARLANLLLNTGVTPAALLCLCPTEAMAKLLHWHLRQLIGAAVDQVAITTFPALSNLVLQEQQALLPVKQPAYPFTHLENIRFLKQLIDRFETNNLLKKYRTDVYHDMNALEKLFTYLKKNGYSGEYVKHLLHYRPLVDTTTENSTATQPGAQELNGQQLLLKLLAGAGEYAAYNDMLREAHRYHPAEAATLATEALKLHPSLLTTCQQRFTYVQVDAFNRLSQPEHNLLQLLFAGNRVPNLLVADGPQQTTLPGPGAGEALFKTLAITPLLLDAGCFASAKHQFPAINYYNSVPAATERIVTGVDDLLQRGIQPPQITIVCANGMDPWQLHYLLAARNIPYVNQCNSNLLDHPFTRPLIQLLRYIHQQNKMPYSGDALLFELLHAPLFQIPPAAIAALLTETNRKKHSTTPTGMRSYLQQAVNATPKDLFDTGLQPALKNAFLLIESMIEQSTRLSLCQLFDIIQRQELVSDYLESQKQKQWLTLMLNALHQFIQSTGIHQPALQLDELMELLDIMETEHFELPMEATCRSEMAVQLIDASAFTPGGGNYLFIAGSNQATLTPTDWFSTLLKQGRLPAFLNGHPGETIQPQSLEEIAAIAAGITPSGVYVAISAAAGAANEVDANEILPAHNNNSREHQLPIQHQDAPTAGYPAFIPILPTIAAANEAVVKRALDKLVLSASALNSYLRCPLHFFYHYVLRVPNAGNEAMEFGSALHYALEQLFKKLTSPSRYQHHQAAEQFMPATTLVNDFTRYMQAHQANFTKAAFKRRLSYGAAILTNYYQHHKQQWNKVVAIERNISGVSIRGIPIKGKLDKLEFNGRDVTIVDYKSGDYHKALSKLQPPNADQPHGGDYWRQAVFYTLLVNNYQQKNWKVIATEVDFIEPDNSLTFRKVKVPVQDADITTVTQQIIAVSENIRARNFYTGCGKPSCYWCGFVKDNQLTIHPSPHGGKPTCIKPIL